MIKINLATRKQALTAPAATKGGFTMNTKFDSEGLKQIPFVRIGINLAAAFGAYYLLNNIQEEKLKAWDVQLEKQRAEEAQLTAEIGKIAGFETQIKSVVTDQQILQTKMEAIRALTTNRQAAPRLLMTISTGIPKEIWLSSIRVSGAEIRVQGQSYSGDGPGFDQITDFMQVLNHSAYFNDVKLVNTQKDKDDTGTEVASFELTAQKR